MRRTLTGLAIVTIAGLAPTSLAQSQEAPARIDPAIHAELDQHLADWRAEHGAGWILRQDVQTGYGRLLFGDSLEPLLYPADEADWFALGRQALALSQDLHGVDAATLVEDRVKLMPLGIAGTTDKMSIRFRQEVNGVPVIGGSVHLVADMDGKVLAIDNTGLPGLAGFDVEPTISATAARAAVSRWFRQDAGSPATTLGAARLVIDQVDYPGSRSAALAWEVNAERIEDGVEPAGWIYRVDARSGQLVARETTVHHFDVSGTVSSLATPGTAPDGGTNPEVALPMPHITVQSPQGSAVADANGNFNIVGASPPLDVTVSYDGPFHAANNQAQADYVLNQTLSNSSGNALTMNPAANDLTTAEANSHLWVNEARDWIKLIDPTDTTPDFTAQSNLNLPSTCNAFFNGVSINFYPAGGGCANTSFSTVVVHELGHWYQVLYNTQNGPDGMGEGGADIWAMFACDTPIVGQDFFGSGVNIRDGNNAAPYWGDANTCGLGGVHACGQVFMGAMWKMLTNLRATHGQASGRVIASALYLGWQNGFDQQEIKEIIVDQLMILDDNDGNIHNGTPNSVEINSAFVSQGFNGFTPKFVSFSGVTALTDTSDQARPNTVTANIVANINSAVVSADLMVSTNGNPYVAIPMVNTGGTSWTADIGGRPCVRRMRYYVRGTDNAGMSELFPEGGAADPLRFLVGNINTLLLDDFEGAPSWTGGDPGDTATTGMWERGDPNGSLAQPEDDRTPAGSICWFTGQAAPGAPVGTNDIDDGFTTLTSPLYDLSGVAEARISYWRWFSNNVGVADDTLRVEITNSNGAAWTPVETVGPSSQSTGWKQHSFLVSDILPPTANVRLRFIAEDVGAPSIVEAAIDDLHVEIIDNDCTGAVLYCQAKQNSLGCVPFITTVNNASVTSSLPFRIIANDVIPNEAGHIIYGTAGRLNLNFHNGKLCVKLPFVRLPLKKSGNAQPPPCSGRLTFNFNNRIQNGLDPSLTAGQEVNAQWIYRDPTVDLFGDGLSGGVEFVIEP